MPTTVYTQIFEDPAMEFLGPMDINLSVYNDTAIHTLRTCVILLVSPIDGHRHDTKFYVAQLAEVFYSVVRTHYTCN